MSNPVVYTDKKALMRDFLFCVREMRRFQRQWFAGRKQEDIRGAKQYEKRVDELLFAIANFGVNQPSLIEEEKENAE